MDSSISILSFGLRSGDHQPYFLACLEKDRGIVLAIDLEVAVFGSQYLDRSRLRLCQCHRRASRIAGKSLVSVIRYFRTCSEIWPARYFDCPAAGQDSVHTGKVQ